MRTSTTASQVGDESKQSRKPVLNRAVHGKKEDDPIKPVLYRTAPSKVKDDYSKPVRQRERKHFNQSSPLTKQSTTNVEANQKNNPLSSKESKDSVGLNGAVSGAEIENSYARCKVRSLRVQAMQGNTLFYIYSASRLHNSCSIEQNMLRDISVFYRAL